MPANFTPDEEPVMTEKLDIPYIEDARADFAPGYATVKTQNELKKEITEIIQRMGGARVTIRSGTFGAGDDVRYGFQVAFLWQGNPSVIQVAGLPIRTFTEKKKEQSLRQALYIVRDQLRASLSAMIFSPGFQPLVQFQLVPGSDKTVGEMLVIRNELPNLNPSLPARIDRE